MFYNIKVALFTSKIFNSNSESKINKEIDFQTANVVLDRIFKQFFFVKIELQN